MYALVHCLPRTPTAYRHLSIYLDLDVVLMSCCAKMFSFFFNIQYGAFTSFDQATMSDQKFLLCDMPVGSG